MGSAECITGQVWPAIICICITLIFLIFILILLILLILVILIPIVIVINHRSGQLVWLFKAIDNQERHTFCQVRSYWWKYWRKYWRQYLRRYLTTELY